MHRLKLETMKKLFFIVTTLIIIFNSCSTDFEVNAPWEDKTIIFGLLDQSDSVQYVKINKAFLGKDDAYNMAAVSDSFNYSNLNVSLQRFRNDELVQTILLEPTNEIVKDTGIFATDNNLVYKTNTRIYRNADYKIIVEIPATGKIVYAETTTIDSFKIERPFDIQTTSEIPINFAQTAPVQIKWKPARNSKLCYITMYFNYYDIVGTDSILQQIELSLSPNVYTSTDNDGLSGTTPNEVKDLYGEDFYKFVASSLDVPETGTKRLAKSLDFEFYCASDDYYTYYQVNNSTTGLSQDKPLFTNVKNGYGLFTSKYKQTVYAKKLNPESLDSLSRGRYTKHLKFADGSNSWN